MVASISSLGASPAFRSVSRTWPMSRRYPEIDSPTSKCGFQLDQHRGRTHIDERAGLGVENDDLGLVGAECLNLRLDVVCVGEHQPGLDSDHDRVWTRRQIGMPVGV
jgi:hypothetical protein